MADSGRQTDSQSSSTMPNDGRARSFQPLSLFQQVLFFLFSLVTAGKFPLQAIALLPPLLRRKLFLLLPILNLHRIERQCPVATEGITMEKVWEELFSERLCRETKWLAKPRSLKLRFDGEHWDLVDVGSGSLGMKDLLRVVLPVPLTEDFTQSRMRGFEQITVRICHWHCQECKKQKFYCSPKHIHLFTENRYPNPPFEMTALESTILEVITVLLEHCPLELHSLSIGILTGNPSVNLEGVEFCRLLNHIHTLEVQVTKCQYTSDTLESSRTFTEALLNVLVSNPHSALRNLHLIEYNFSKCCKTLNNAIAMFFSPMSTRNDVVPFLKLKKLGITTTKVSLKSAATAKLVLREIVDIVNHQEELEVLELSGTCNQKRPSIAHEALFQAAGKCFLKPTFQCLTLTHWHMTTPTVLDIQHHFLVSFAHREQKLILKNMTIYSSSDRKNVFYSSENAACRKSLSVLGCSSTDVRLFSTADIASEVLSHPGTKYVEISGNLVNSDLLKLTASLEKSTGTLKLLY